MSARNAAYESQLAAALEACVLPADVAIAHLARQISRLVLVLELERLEGKGYETGGVSTRRWERCTEIRAELGWDA